ncbi:MFS transporter [Nocardioides perillae]|uniref:CP family cyanate transporter-like MFS transporter n=1 Tax=Nocardioides perillae TaxID=1119534 RepID=A0A7Y9RXQ3_9ACTN|nr:CP family cyanate transporter-like MFS transporter [Nocardioides perillae]
MTGTATTRTPAPLRTRWLVLAGIVLLSVNLRPAAVSVGPVLEEVRAALEMGGAAAGLLTSLPVLAFAGFGALAPGLAARVGVHRVTLLSLLAVVGGLLARAAAGSGPTFLLWSAVALAGMATANVLLPSLVKLHFPDRTGLLTSVYTTALALGLTAALTLTAPLESVVGWRPALATWAGLAAVAALPWVALATHDRRLDRRARAVSVRSVLRTRLGAAMALFFGLQSMQAYAVFGWFATLWRDAGSSAEAAGALVGLVAGVSIPLSALVPSLAARRESQVGIHLALMACYPVGYLGLVLGPTELAWVWAVFVGTGLCSFPLALTLVNLRSRTPEGTAALSGSTQAAGYLLAAAGPFAVGVVHDATGGWTVPVLLLLVLTLPQALVGIYCARPGAVEDQLADRTRGRRG